MNYPKITDHNKHFFIILPIVVSVVTFIIREMNNLTDMNNLTKMNNLMDMNNLLDMNYLNGFEQSYRYEQSYGYEKSYRYEHIVLYTPINELPFSQTHCTECLGGLIVAGL